MRTQLAAVLALPLLFSLVGCVQESAPEAKWVVFYSLGDGADAGAYYDAHPIEQMGYQLTMLAYDMIGGLEHLVGFGDERTFGQRGPAVGELVEPGVEILEVEERSED